ncbi:Ribonuclease H-like domain containing protein [Trema orientale]|uniref:Ribonuclease H-like domain containing protein n=1 Tax=Trema orientale TaxID=63057 RepID=A0A2P5EJA8_TREOI|nr:Ribonuclease H-like domain containing protein [Trema orientale]
MWQLRISPKIRVFIWRVFYGAIPVCTKLISRQIAIVWREQNHVLHGGVARSADSQAAFADSLLYEYQAVTGVFNCKSPPALKSPGLWQAPRIGCIKMNSDASVRVGTDSIGTGIVFRDYFGTDLAVCSSRLRGSFSIECSELLAIRYGLLAALEWGAPVSIIESDAQSVICGLNSSDSLGDLDLIYSDI